MNKTESLETLKRRLDALETEAAELRKALEAQEPVEKKPLVQAKDERGFAVLHDDDGYAASVRYTYRNSFETKAQAQAYAEAFNTLLDLRRQPGSEAAVDGKAQWFIDANGEIVRWRTDLKMSLLCPPFDSHDSALAAKEAVGWGRIKKMMDTLHGRGYEVL